MPTAFRASAAASTSNRKRAARVSDPGNRTTNMEGSKMIKYIVSAIALGVCVTAGVSTVVLGDEGGNGFQLRLEGFQENPSISTPARGRLRLQIQNNDTIEYRLEYSGFEGTVVTASHIHLGARHTNGGVSAF